MGYYLCNRAFLRDFGKLYWPHCKKLIRLGDKYMIHAVDPLAVAHATCEWEQAERRQRAMPHTEKE